MLPSQKLSILLAFAFISPCFASVEDVEKVGNKRPHPARSCQTSKIQKTSNQQYAASNQEINYTDADLQAVTKIVEEYRRSLTKNPRLKRELKAEFCRRHKNYFRNLDSKKSPKCVVSYHKLCRLLEIKESDLASSKTLLEEYQEIRQELAEKMQLINSKVTTHAAKEKANLEIAVILSKNNLLSVDQLNTQIYDENCAIIQLEEDIEYLTKIKSGPFKIINRKLTVNNIVSYLQTQPDLPFNMKSQHQKKIVIDILKNCFCF